MRFAQVHKVAVYTLGGLGLVALGAGGELPPWSTVAVALGTGLSWFAEGELLHDERYNRAWNIALVLAFAVQCSRWAFFGADLLVAIVEFAAFLQILKLSTRRTARDYQIITLLSGLMLIAATVLGGGLSYAACFVGFVLFAPWAMTLGHLRREIEGNYLADARAGRAGVPIDVARILRSRRVVGAGLLAGSSLLSVPIFLLTAVIFVLFPRIGLGVLTVRSRAEATVAGFGTSVDLTGHGTIRNDPTIVLRVQPRELPPQPPPLRPFRLRGATFDTYTGRGWSRHTNLPGEVRSLQRDGTLYTLSRLPDPDRDEALRVVLDPLDPPVVPVPDGAAGFQIDARFEGGLARYTSLSIDRDDGVRYSGLEEVGLVYTAFVPRTREAPSHRVLAYGASPWFQERYLQLPRDLPASVRRLAHEWTDAEATPLAKARAVERRLQNYRYTLRLESGGASQPLEDFLFRSRAGHCEYFSTAMAVLLRTVGVPTRNVTGFLGGTFNRYGRFYAVHQGDAHSWVEVWDASRGWVTFDPTPPAGEVPLLRRGLVAEIDAVLEAVRLRWRQYIVGFDLSTQARIARRVWTWLERRRGHPVLPHRLVANPDRRMRTGFPWRGVAVVVIATSVIAALAWQLRGWRRASSELRGRSLRPSARGAIELARALDQALVAAGHGRPLTRSPLAFAEELERTDARIGPVALRVAKRYVAARFGDDALAPGELDSLREDLKAALRAPPA